MRLRSVRVLVTGGAGFLGSHLVDALAGEGAHVIVVDNLSTGRRSHVPPEAEFSRMDVASPGLARVFSRAKPQLVYHLAANTNVPLGVGDSRVDLHSLAGTVNVLEECRQGNVRRVVLTSTGFIYGNAARRPVTEGAAFQPISPYAITKYASEHYLRFYRDAFGLPGVILRLATAYGPRQVTGAMADYIRQLAAGRQAVIYGDGSKTRDYVYASDIVDALLRVLDPPREYPEPVFNVGTGRETSLRDLYARIAALLHREARPVYRPDRRGELLRYALDASKLRRALGWKPRVDLNEGLRRTVAAFVDRR